MNRQRFVLTSAATALGGGSAFAPLAARAAAARPTPVSVRIGYLGRPCEAATFIAPQAAGFHSAGLDVRLVRFRTENELVAAVGAGTVDAASVTLPALLEPLAGGAAVRVVAGLHAGCLRVVAPNVVEINSLNDLRGKTLATDRLHGASMNLLSALLFRSGVNPRRDVTWRVYDPADLDTALDAKTVACVATSDPLGFLLLRAKKVEPYLDNADGGFSCGGDLARGHHCFLAMHDGLVRTRPRVAAALTGAYLDTSQTLTRGIGPAALAEAQHSYVDADISTIIAMLSTYDWTASTEFVLEEIELTARDFKRAGLLAHDTDPQRLAENAFADVLHA